MIASGFVAGAGFMLALVQALSNRPNFFLVFLGLMMLMAGAFCALEAWEHEKARVDEALRKAKRDG